MNFSVKFGKIEIRHDSIERPDKVFYPPWDIFKFEFTKFDNVMLVNCYYIFTDGSKLDNRVACGFVVFYNGLELYSEMIKMNKEASVFDTELVAIDRAIHYITLNEFDKVKIVSDSYSALQAICSFINPRVNKVKNNLNNYDNVI